MIEYLPLYMREFAEIKTIMDTEQVVIGNAWSHADNVLNDQFVVDATDEGLKRLESILGITPKANYTIDERRFHILTRLNEQLPYTMGTLNVALTSLCGPDGYTLKLDPNKYILVIKLALDNESNIEAVSALLEKMLPANIMKNVVLFNTHFTLSDFTHEQLAKYTHKELRGEIL